MRLMCLMVCLFLMLPTNALPARLDITVPQDITDVKILSPGTAAVLDHHKSRLKTQMKIIEDKYQVSWLESEVKKAALTVEKTDKAYKERIDGLRVHNISKISITIHSVIAEITPESALGDISYTYTATNSSDRIVSDIIYKPMLAKSALGMTSSLVLEFINPKTLIFGLGPGESLTNVGHDPEHFSFFLNELSGKDIKKIQSSLPGGFTIDIIDLHFLSQKGYKDQTKVMDVKEAFASQLRPVQALSQQAKDEQKAKTLALTNARKLYEGDTQGILKEFRSKMKDLQQSSVRYDAQVDTKKNRGMIDSIKPGKYYLYATGATHQAIFDEITVKKGKNKIRIKTDTLKKDPFEP